MTFSLIAIDRATQALGIACATGGPALGGFVPHLMPGVGAGITQGYSTNVLAAERGLDLLTALAAGELAGGDYRGVRSSALKVRAKGGIPLDLRIDDAHDAVPALVRLYRHIQDDADFQAFLARLPTAEAPHRH